MAVLQRRSTILVQTCGRIFESVRHYDVAICSLRLLLHFSCVPLRFPNAQGLYLRRFERFSLF